MSRADLLLRNARLTDGRLVDLGIDGGVFIRIGEDLELDAERELDARGRLTIPPFIDSHVHLDAVLTVGEPRFNRSGTLLEGIEIWGERKQSLSRDDVKHRALEAIKWEVAQGTLFIRSHVDVCDPELTALRALIELREEVRDLVELQLVAFPQDGIYATPGGPALMEEALRLGADVVGGIPHHEPTRALGERDVHLASELAKKYARPLDLHIDETDDPNSRFTEVLAWEAVEGGFGSRATASHCTAMHSYDDAYAFKLIRLLARSSINVVANPFDNTVLQGRFDTYPKRRGMARVKELLEGGVNVSLGHDSIMDPWYPLGRGDMLGAASLALHVLQMSGEEEIGEMLELVTNRAARTLGVEDGYGIEEGRPASFVVLDAPGTFDALRLDPARLWVVKDGRIVAETEPSRTTLYRGGGEESVDFSRNPEGSL
ncbi:cytosine deaminase [Rubrobacter calidifluminis]|uniref:cytosine deaminase n=1 Tax=Rubrobacter calidifluminis TaxID=1392640 RepID=UPI0023600706|nr:cytosine deaminase [Rubrobacter calidifluminis]